MGIDAAKLRDKLARIQALLSGAATRGEQEAAAEARARVLHRLRQLEREDPPVEYSFSLIDEWDRKLFLALLRRYGLEPYRYKAQQFNTVMVRVSKRFVDEVLWPEYRELSETLRGWLNQVTHRVIADFVHPDASEAVVIAPERLEGPRR